MHKLHEVKNKLKRKSPTWLKLLFWKAKMLKITGQKSTYITCTGKTDGIGAQTQAVLSTMMFARELGLIYAHTSFKGIAHNVDRESAACKWENFLGLGQGEVSTEDPHMDKLDILYVDSPREIHRKCNTLYVIKHCHDFADEFPDCYSKSKEKILRKYRSVRREKYKSHYKADTINIALHIRRGDVDATRMNRFTNNEYYQRVVADILSVLDSLQLKASVHLYSQGLVEDFPELSEFEIFYHLDECPFETFYNLTTADVLVMSKSSFSYSAALLSDAIKIYQPFWHKPLKHWIVAKPKSSAMQVNFNQSQLKQQLATIRKA